MTKAFASAGDMEDKAVSFTEIGEGLYAFTAEGDPNSGVIIGDDSVMVIEAQATPRLARKMVEAGLTDQVLDDLLGVGVCDFLERADFLEESGLELRFPNT